MTLRRWHLGWRDGFVAAATLVIDVCTTQHWRDDPFVYAVRLAAAAAALYWFLKARWLE